MDEIRTITVRDYLNDKNIAYRERNGELITKCLFNGCDKDSKRGEAHLYINPYTGQFDCKKCGAKGNIFTLTKHFGDKKSDVIKNFPQYKSKKDFASLVDSCHQNLPQEIRKYLNSRGIINEVIDKRKIGYGDFYKRNWITIPVKDKSGEYIFFKLREDPQTGNHKHTYPRGSQAQIYPWDLLGNNPEKLIICEGELDALLLESMEIPAVTSTAGAATFKDEWIAEFKQIKEIFTCYDNDKVGRLGALNALNRLNNEIDSGLYKITLPSEVGDKGDVTDYFIKLNGNTADLFEKYSSSYPERIDITKFKPFYSKELIKVLELTIKEDNENKVATFLCMLSAYTYDSQLNIIYNAPSSTGKSYIPIEISKLFPEEDILSHGYCSPKAFFHDSGDLDFESKTFVVDLSNKILIFLDQPHDILLEHLRPILSHDQKEINIKITDKSQKFGLRAKNILLIGYPSVIFCTARFNIDEQEVTRFLLLSPDISDGKIRQGINESIKRQIDNKKYTEELESNPDRKLLKERIRAIKLQNIADVKIENEQAIKDLFFNSITFLLPKHQRDIARLISFIKTFSLLNCFWRKKTGNEIIADNKDIEEAFYLWKKIFRYQELNIPPYICNFYYDIIVAAYNEKNTGKGKIKEGLDRKEIMAKYYEVHKSLLSDCLLRQQIIPMLETTGLVYQENDSIDKRKILIFPTEFTDKRNRE
jgi:hypothetical protein